MLVTAKIQPAAAALFSHADHAGAGYEAWHAAQTALARRDFSGSCAEWCGLGFSICEGYLLEAQGMLLDADATGLLAMIEAQPDPELAAEVLAQANSLICGMAFRHLAGRLQLVETGAVGMNWPVLAELWRAMELGKGDMRMPRLAPVFERRLREALRLS